MNLKLFYSPPKWLNYLISSPNPKATKQSETMKFQLGPNDRIDQHHMYGLIQTYMESVKGYVEPEYIIIHPDTFYKIMQAVGEAGDQFRMTVTQWSPTTERIKMYGVDVIRSYDVEEDFVIIT